MTTPLECLLLLQENFEDDISGRLSATGGYRVKLSIMEAFIGVAVPSEKTLRSLDTNWTLSKQQMKAERRTLERSGQMPVQVRTAAQILFCRSQVEN